MAGFDNRRMLDTIRRLNRRNSKITLYKYINKIHPSQMVYVYRHLLLIERKNIFQYIVRMQGVGEFIKELGKFEYSLNSLEANSLKKKSFVDTPPP